jgi:hypothetical protein
MGNAKDHGIKAFYYYFWMVVVVVVVLVGMIQQLLHMFRQPSSSLRIGRRLATMGLQQHARHAKGGQDASSIDWCRDTGRFVFAPRKLIQLSILP